MVFMSFSFLVPSIDSFIRFLLRSGVGHDDDSAGWGGSQTLAILGGVVELPACASGSRGLTKDLCQTKQ
jgi:hypothetical protein